MISADFDLAMVPHFIEHYQRIGVAPENMYLTLHASKEMEQTLGAVLAYPINYRIYAGRFNTFTKFELQVRELQCSKRTF